MAFKRSYSKKEAPSNTSSSDDTVIDLDNKKRITVRKFNGVNLVDIREFYVDKDTDEKKPGKKGISLTEEAWLKLIEVSGDVHDALDKLNGVENKRRKPNLEESNDQAKNATSENDGDGSGEDTEGGVKEEEVNDEDEA